MRRITLTLATLLATSCVLPLRDDLAKNFGETNLDKTVLIVVENPKRPLSDSFTYKQPMSVDACVTELTRQFHRRELNPEQVTIRHRGYNPEFLNGHVPSLKRAPGTTYFIFPSQQPLLGVEMRYLGEALHELKDATMYVVGGKEDGSIKFEEVQQRRSLFKYR